MKGKKSEILHQILGGLALGAAVAIILSSRTGSRKLIRNIRHELKLEKMRKEYLMQKFYYLRERKLVSFVEKDGEIEIMITEKGKKQLLKYNFANLELKKPKRWDGKWRVVLFDIPEHKKQARDALRMKLTSLGLICFNDSAWIFPFECNNEVDFVAEVFGVGQFVHYLSVESITNDENLRLKFGLS